jgi:hypothetical protein
VVITVEEPVPTGTLPVPTGMLPVPTGVVTAGAVPDGTLEGPVGNGGTTELEATGAEPGAVPDGTEAVRDDWLATGVVLATPVLRGPDGALGMVLLLPIGNGGLL